MPVRKVIDALQDTMTSSAAINGWAAHQPIEICEAAYHAAQAGSGEISCDAAANAIRNIRRNRNGPDIAESLPEI